MTTAAGLDPLFEDVALPDPPQRSTAAPDEQGRNVRGSDAVQVTIEAPIPTARLIRVAGRLDRAAAASVLRLVDAQLAVVAGGHRAVAHVVIDVEAVSGFEPGGLDLLRNAVSRADRRAITLWVSGCGGRVHLLPLPSRQALARFRTFPTAELALDALAGGVAVDRPHRPSAPEPAADRFAMPIPPPRPTADDHVDGPVPEAVLSG